MRLCFCGVPVFGTDKKTRVGYCKSHQYMRTDLDKRSIVQKEMDKKKYDGPKLYIVDDEPLQYAVSGGAELQRWFDERRKEFTGKCKHCGGRSFIEAVQREGEDDVAFSGRKKNHDRYYKHCIAHILPKKLFKSVATHPLNWIELCFWNNSCHTNFDNFALDITELNCFDEVIEKFIAIYPDIDKKERRLIPEALRQYVPIDI
jgi:hypothetical protein